MYLPNVREDEAYNQKYLTEENKTFLEGFDFAVDKVLDTVLANLDCYDLTVEGDDIDIVRILNNHPKIAEKLEVAMKHHFESERNELVVSMIDGMDDGEYERIKAVVDAKED